MLQCTHPRRRVTRQTQCEAWELSNKRRPHHFCLQMPTARFAIPCGARNSFSRAFQTSWFHQERAPSSGLTASTQTTEDLVSLLFGYVIMFYICKLTKATLLSILFSLDLNIAGREETPQKYKKNNIVFSCFRLCLPLPSKNLVFLPVHFQKKLAKRNYKLDDPPKHSKIWCWSPRSKK